MSSSSKRPWQEAMSDLITDPAELLQLLELDPSLLAGVRDATRAFALKVPRRYVARMEKGNINDPLLKQLLPLDDELKMTLGYERDPLQEMQVNPIPGLLHKYHGRVLVTLTSACAVHCRYCFRRHFPYDENNPGLSGWEKIFSYIEQDDTLHEVILSGGDPLAVSDKLLQKFSDELSRIPHVKRLRIHTRLPLVLPERMTDTLREWFSQLTLQPVIVLHTNHPREINEEVKLALRPFRDAGITLLNQTVLLKGVNDDATTLIALSEILFSAGVLPYYLHVLDKVAGAAHFDLPRHTAQDLHAILSAKLPGYLVPRLVCEVAGAAAKTVVAD